MIWTILGTERPGTVLGCIGGGWNAQEGGLAECAGILPGEPPTGVPGAPGVASMRAILPSVLSVSDALNALQLLGCVTAWLQIQCPQPIPQPIPQQMFMSYDCFDAVVSLLYFQQPYGCGFSLVYIYMWPYMAIHVSIEKAELKPLVFRY